MNNLLSELIRNNLVSENKAIAVYKIKNRIAIIEKQLDRLYEKEISLKYCYSNENKINQLENQLNILRKGI